MWRFVILFSLFVTFLLPASAQRDRVDFALNGQTCTNGKCAINVASYGSGRPLRLTLAGTVPSRQPLEVSLVLRTNESKRPKGVTLEFDGYSLSPGKKTLRISSANAHKLWRSDTPMLLHLGELNASATGYIEVEVRGVRTNVVISRAHITLEGLRTPGERIGWERQDPFSTVRPIVVPIYPNPIKEGLIHMDLQGIPRGQTGEVSIIDVLGTRVYSTPFKGGTMVQCPSEQLSKGIYFVRIDVDGSILYTGRLVVDK